MSEYVSHIQSWRTGEPIDPLVPANLPPGDFAEVHYDLDRIGRDVDRDSLSHGAPSMWRYAPLLPVDDFSNIVSLGEGFTPMLPAPEIAAEFGVRELFLKDEGQNPSGTFKDRGASASVSRLRELGVRTVVHNSSGNAGGSWAMYCARAGLQCVNVLPEDVMPASLAQSLLSGARTLVLDGAWNAAGAIVADALERHGWFDVRTLREPYRLEGKKTMGFEIAEQLGWALPDAIVYPTGGGIGAVAIYKGLSELQKLGWIEKGPLPKLIVTQFAGCAPIVRAFENGDEAADEWLDLDVPPGGLKSVRPPGDRKVLEWIRETNGAAFGIKSQDALDMVRSVARAEGIFQCPESATAVVGLKMALKQGIVAPSDRVIVVSTGSGMKSVPIVMPGQPDRLVKGGAIS
ncbi:MAG: threonine synthase [Alphaproteobacteria bacterium]|nr:threonine synthase [Alphaproteobacteria bacterium]